jgi:tetratricopeptide (TPR) repeat protein
MTDSLASDNSLSSIGHYELRKRLGEGGYGQVYEAWDQLLHRSVALKCLTNASGQAGSERLMREARLAASLHHPAFVKIFGFEENGRAEFIVMELVRGSTLRGQAADCTADPPRALDIIDQIAAAMAEAHAAGLVHGDLKPGNLMLQPGGAVRILDFGLARHIDPLATQTGVPEDPLGTIAYMAPERLAGLPPSAATDIYALGVVLYELLNGERPYAGLHGLALASAHMHTSSHQWQYPRYLDPGLLQLILAMTARDPAARLRSMDAVRTRIAQLRDAPLGLSLPAAAAPTPAATVSAAPQPHPPPKRDTRLALLLGGAVLAIAATTAVLVDRPPRLAPAAPYSESALMQAGMEALRHVDRDGQIERALASFGAILSHTPKHAGAAGGQSLAYSMRYSGDGRDEVWLLRAASAAALAVQENDQLSLAHAAQSWVAALRGQGTAALAAADRALALDPSDTSALTAKIYVLLRMQRHDDARALIAQARARWPNERAFTDLEGTLLYQRGDYAGAELAFRRSLLLEPDAVQPYANLSAALLRQARGDEALAVLQQGLRVQPSGVLYSNLGTVLYSRGDFPGAGAAFEHAVSAAKGGPNDYLKWANLADALRWIPGREQAARDAYRRAMQLLRPILARAPDDPTFLTRMGLYAAHLGNEPEALNWTERGAAAAPANPDVRFRAALANELSGRRSAALGHLARAIALGYPFSSIESEPELVALRRDARYQTLAMEHKR